MERMFYFVNKLYIYDHYLVLDNNEMHLCTLVDVIVFQCSTSFYFIL